MADYNAEDLTPDPTLQEQAPEEIFVEAPTGGGTVILTVPVGDLGEL
jgi:hypothetical protein